MYMDQQHVRINRITRVNYSNLFNDSETFLITICNTNINLPYISFIIIACTLLQINEAR